MGDRKIKEADITARFIGTERVDGVLVAKFKRANGFDCHRLTLEEVKTLLRDPNHQERVGEIIPDAPLIKALGALKNG